MEQFKSINNKIASVKQQLSQERDTPLSIINSLDDLLRFSDSQEKYVKNIPISIRKPNIITDVISDIENKLNQIIRKKESKGLPNIAEIEQAYMEERRMRLEEEGDISVIFRTADIEKTKLNSLQTELNTLKDKSAILNTNNTKLNDENNTLRTERDKLQNENKDLKNENAKLNDTLKNENKEFKRELNTLKTERGNLQNVNTNLNNQLGKLQTELNTLKDENANLNNQLGKLQTELNKSKDESAILNKKNTKLQNENDALNNQLGNLQNEFVKSKNETQELIQKLRNCEEQLNRHITNTKEESLSALNIVSDSNSINANIKSLKKSLRDALQTNEDNTKLKGLYDKLDYIASLDKKFDIVSELHNLRLYIEEKTDINDTTRKLINSKIDEVISKAG